jgi:hypothetical protein
MVPGSSPGGPTYWIRVSSDLSLKPFLFAQDLHRKYFFDKGGFDDYHEKLLQLSLNQFPKPLFAVFFLISSLLMS